MTIGLFGGTFNPLHTAHLIVAEAAREALRLDRVLFIPAALAPHKHLPALAPAAARLEMVRIGTAGNPGFEVSEVEISRGGVSYTIDTLRAVSRMHPGASLKLLIGADNLFDFEQWKRPDEILQAADLVVMSRPGFERAGASPVSARATVITVPQIAISSTDIRRRVRFGQSIRYMVPAAVEEYIRAHRLYQQ